MAGLIKASSMIQPAYLSPHRKRRESFALFLCKTCTLKCEVASLGLNSMDRNRKGKSLRILHSCSIFTTQLRPMPFARVEDSSISLNVVSTVSQLSSNLEAVPAESLGISAESTESTVPLITHPLLNFLLEAYSISQSQTLLAAVILAAIVAVATIIVRSDNESHLERLEDSLVIVSHPSQFHRCVSMRCPSMSSLRSAKILVPKRTYMKYQRVCLHAPDGGVVAIDWPVELDFDTYEDNFANILLLVPGTTEGSEDEGVKQFVNDAMHYGYFPVVLNPRGCANSPVTTPRVFSGADSDDVRLVVEHIVRQRPGSTLMGVGWGWGANMLTKYLGEEAGSTPLMAAVALSNPFDLHQSSMHLRMTNNGQFDRIMAKGLVSILEANKVLFVGHKKGFDLSTALASTSVREFDATISRVTYGFDTLEEFYSAASSARYVNSVQVPLLCVQGEDFAIPATSVPYSILEANPFTTALVAQIPASNSTSAKRVVREPGSASGHEWSHTVAFEWLAAVEVALLKGQHPLLNLVNPYDPESNTNAREQPPVLNNVPIQVKDILPSLENSKVDNSVEALKGDDTSMDEKDDTFMQEERDLLATKAEEAEGNEMIEGTDGSKTSEKRDLRAESSSSETERNSLETNGTLQDPDNNSSELQENPPEEDVVEEVAEEVPDVIQMKAAAESVMNVLDITMPGTLSDEQKAQVLKAVGEGESILTALQEAVPEEVRGSMAAAVSGAVQARGISFNLVGFGKKIPPPTLPTGLIDSIKGKLSSVSGGKEESVTNPPHLSGDSLTSGGLENIQSAPPASRENEDGVTPSNPVANPSEVQKADKQDVGSEHVKQEDKNQSGGPNDSGENSAKDTPKDTPKDAPKDTLKDPAKDASKDAPQDSKEPNSEELKDNTESKPFEGKRESTGDKPEEIEQTGDRNQDVAEDAPVGEAARKEDKKAEDTAPTTGSMNAKEEKKPVEETTPESPAAATPTPPAPTSENSAPPPPPAPTSETSAPSVPPISPLDMRLAFQALTGFDDSTQMAVTNVFGVVESMLEKLDQEQKEAAEDDAANIKEGSDDQDSSKEYVKEEGSSKISNNNERSKEDDSKENGDAGNGKGEVDSKENCGTGNGKEEVDSKVAGSSPLSKHIEKDGATKAAAAAAADKDSKKIIYGGENGCNTRRTDEIIEKGTAADVGVKNQGEVNEVRETTNVPEKSNQVMDIKESAMKLLSTKLLNGDSVQKPQSKVLLIQKEGNFTTVERPLNGRTLESSTDDSLPSVNGVASKPKGFSVGQEAFETQQRKLMQVEDSTKPVISGMTIEQLSQEIDQEIGNEDNSSGEDTVHDDGTIEAEVTGINEMKASNPIEDMLKDALKLELLRRLGVAGMESLGIDLEQEVGKVANSVAVAVQRWKKGSSAGGLDAGKSGILSSDTVISALGTVMGGTRILGGLVPIGVLTGVILASLGAVYLIVTDKDQDKEEDNKKVGGEGEEEIAKEPEEDPCASDAESNNSSWHKVKESAVDVPVLSINRRSESPISGFSELEDPEVEAAEAVDGGTSDEDDQSSELEESCDVEEDKAEGNKRSKVMNMMAAAVTGGATLAGMNMSNKDDPGVQKDGQPIEGVNKDMEKERVRAGIISSIHPLAEKALSVAAPVVPHKEDGEIDHERLVAMLAELGQRGGFLRLIGKVALLWGGLRGAMSLTDRLLVFLQVNQRPLHLRLVGFAAMVVLLWSPVLIPVLPSLLQQWATKAPGGVADAASVVGLYGAILILVTIWGKRVRGYNKPLLRYGLRFWSKRKAKDLGLGLALGGGLVTFLYSSNFILGYVQFNWNVLFATNPKLPGTAGVALFTFIKISKLLGQAVGVGLAVALVEEVLFRAWLQEEIAVDLGFHKAVFLSAVAFALVHWSPPAMPGLWFLSVALAGARAKMNRNLAFPIGLHAGLVSINYVLTVGGIVQYMHNAPTDRKSVV